MSRALSEYLRISIGKYLFLVNRNQTLFHLAMKIRLIVDILSIGRALNGCGVLPHSLLMWELSTTEICIINLTDGNKFGTGL